MRRANLLSTVNDDPKNLLTEQIHTDVFIEGLRIETSEKDPSYSENGIPEILAGTKTVIRLFGFGFTEDTLITFTDEQAERGTICDKIKSNEFLVSISNLFYFLAKMCNYNNLIIIISYNNK